MEYETFKAPSGLGKVTPHVSQPNKGRVVDRPRQTPPSLLRFGPGVTSWVAALVETAFE